MAWRRLEQRQRVPTRNCPCRQHTAHGVGDVGQVRPAGHRQAEKEREFGRQYPGGGRRGQGQVDHRDAGSCHRRFAAQRDLVQAAELGHSWIGDRARCRAAGVPDEVGFRTKPEQLRLMVERAVAEGVPFAWLTADEAYGQNPALREWLHEQDISYVMAIRCDERVDVDGGRREVRDLIRELPWHRWRRVSAGRGAHGEREYDWCRVKISCGRVGRSRWVMARRSLSSGEIAYYLCFAPLNASLKALVRVAGTRWAVEESFQTGKNECGLDQYQVRKYHAWYRHMALSMAVHAALTVARAAERDRAKGAADRERMS